MSKNRYFLLLSIATLIAAAGIFGILWYNARLIFDESIYVTEDTYEYNLLISDSIKAMPVYKPILGTVRYHYSAGDGNKPQSDSLEFETPITGQDIQSFYRQYLISMGYMLQQPESGSEESNIYGGQRENFSIYVREFEGKNEVIIYHQQI